MRKLLISRPKSEEKYYSEAKIKVYINDQFVAALKQGETKEVDLEENGNIKIQGKSRPGIRSENKTISLSSVSGLELFLNPKSKKRSIIYAILIPITTILVSNLGFSDIWGILSII